MTILQLKYVIEIASVKSMREAARRLYMSQPALSSSIKDLEDEIGFQIFMRNSRGVSLSSRGEEFLSYAKKAVSQYEVVESRYVQGERRKVFSVAMQHYVFAVHAFMDVVKRISAESYSVSVYETRTNKVLESVRSAQSGVGVISYSSATEAVMKKVFKEYQLKFYPLMKMETYVYLWKDHPLAHKKEVSLEELKDYPCVLFEQGSDKNFFLSEEALADYNYQKVIRTNDRATSSEIIAGLNGYSVGTGMMTKSNVFGKGIISVKLKEEETLTIGYIIRNGYVLSDIEKEYIEELKKYV